jgi:gamma-glutamylcyclotransferase (GGCT)/AIG2-like uncharacterized protein YtfP
MTTKVFVYGTLKRGRPLDRSLFEKTRKAVEEATISGSIYNLGPYPTVKLDNKHTVHGEVHTYNEDDFDDILKTMDLIEGYNPKKPEAGLYNRFVVDAKLKNGQKVQAWVYQFNGEVPKERLIKSGVWEPRK